MGQEEIQRQFRHFEHNLSSMILAAWQQICLNLSFFQEELGAAQARLTRPMLSENSTSIKSAVEAAWADALIGDHYRIQALKREGR